jgi:hypothetical protein
MRRIGWFRVFMVLMIMAGLLALAGAVLAQSEDTDGDGVLDTNDLCPTEPGPVTDLGCPNQDIDTDGDGDRDTHDRCPTDYGSLGGCPVEDGDNVPDNGSDICPLQNGEGSPNGCPQSGCIIGRVDSMIQDGDCDGVADYYDQCTGAAGPASSNGCPLPGAPPDSPLNFADAENTADSTQSSPNIPAPVIASPEELARYANCVVSPRYDERVRIRATPDTDAEVVGTLLPGEIYAVTLAATSPDGDWYQVAGGWVAGWVTQQNAACADLPALGEDITALPVLGGESDADYLYLLYVLSQVFR